jgi:hypothetical protein
MLPSPLPLLERVVSNEVRNRVRGIVGDEPLTRFAATPLSTLSHKGRGKKQAKPPL